MSRKITYPLLFFVLFISAAFILDFSDLLKGSEKADEKIQHKIENNLQSYIKELSVDLNVIKDKIDGKDSLALFESQFENDFLIYSGKKVWFWTDNSLPISNELIGETFLYKILKRKNGYYFAYRVPVDDHTVVFLLRLQEDYPVTNRFLKPKLNSFIFSNTKGKVFLNEQGTSLEIHLADEPLFYLDVVSISKSYSTPVIILYLLASIGFIVLFYRIVTLLARTRRGWLGFFTLLVSIISFRLVLFFTGFFKHVLHIELFEPSVYASSNFTPSIGDFVLHLLCIIIVVAYLYQQIISSKKYRYISLFKTETNYVFMICFVFLSYYSIELIHFFLNDIYVNSTLNFDITKSLEFSSVEYAYGLIFVGLSLLYLMVNRALLKVFFFLYRKDINIAVSLWFVGAFFYYVVSSINQELSVLLFSLHSAYLLLVYSSAIFHEIRSFNFNSYLYIIITSLLTSAIGAYTIYEHTEEKERLVREKFAERLIVHDDFEGEYLLNKVTSNLQEEISSWQLDSSNEFYREAEYSVANMLGHYFDGYEINVLFFDSVGAQLSNEYNKADLDFFSSKFKKERFNTEFDNLYFVNFYDFGEFSKYLSFVSIPDSGYNSISNILVELTSRHLSKNSVYPAVLSSGVSESQSAIRRFNYGVFSNNQLLFSQGPFNYELSVFEKAINKSTPFTHLIKDGYEHVIYKGVSDKLVVVSTADTRLYTLFTNFSFLLLVALISILVIVLFYILAIDFPNVWPNFSTRIHLYLNFIYLIAIISLSAITISWINEEYDHELKENFKSKAENIRLNIIDVLDDYQKGEITLYEFQEYLNRVRDLSRFDLNIYNTDGKLIISSQPLIFKSELVSEFVHPKAYHTLIGKKHNISLEEENIGDFDYFNAYTRLSTINEDQLIGVLGIPFFNSESNLSERKIKLFNTILNVFTCVFIVVLLVSYLAFKSITTPLKMLATRIRNTTLSDKNERIEWKINDEIGWIVQGYNNMIGKLEHSKALMSKRQKEDAWKEMAKQVAHEIKNPLTPMRLKIQHLKRILDQVDKEQMEEFMNSLLIQIDTLNDIASSFSDFAKMPTPSYKALNVIECLNEVKLLFDVDTKIISDYAEDELMVMGDKKFLTRVFNNIIINAIQSVKAGITPQIIIKVVVGKIAVDIQFTDNGEGIPTDIRNKVFEPNFSTKYSGSGLGLAIAQRGLQHSGGKIWFDTELDKGTTFTVQVPLAYINA